MKTTQPDTNYLLRYLLRDHTEHFAMSQEYWNAVREGKTRALLTEGVLMEAVYVLTKFYKVPRKVTAKAIGDMLHYPGMVSADLTLFEEALGRFSVKSLDFVDCLLLARSKQNSLRIMTFDTRLSEEI